MRERSLILGPEEVREVLREGRIELRRAVKPQPVGRDYITDAYGGWHVGHLRDSENAFRKLHCPFGEPGDHLYVKETFCMESCCETGWYEPPHEDGRPLYLFSSITGKPIVGRGIHLWRGQGLSRRQKEFFDTWEQPHYKATDPEPELSIPNHDGPGCRWLSPVVMPRWASRIRLEVEKVGVEELRFLRPVEWHWVASARLLT